MSQSVAATTSANVANPLPYSALYLNPQGPGDARPTALQIITDLKPDRAAYANAVVLITGGSSGIGIETARAFATLGCDIYLPVRDRIKAEAVIKDIESTVGVTAGKIHLLDLDMSSLQSVRDCAKEFISRSKKLNLLINNAGIMGPPESRSVDGFELQFATNHLAHFLLAQLLLPTLLASTTPTLPSRVISLTSSGHAMSPIRFDDFDMKKREGGYQRWLAYGQSKTANIYLATEIERRYGSQGVHAAAVHPGFISTGLTKYMESIPISAEEMPLLGLSLEDWANVGVQYRSIPQGAATTVWAALNHEAKGFCEDSSMAGPKQIKDGESMASIKAKGYAPWAVDEAAAKRLWEESIKMVGL